MQTQSSIEIQRPIAEVFDYTTTRVAEWSRLVVEDKVIETKAGGEKRPGDRLGRRRAVNTRDLPEHPLTGGPQRTRRALTA